MAVVAQITITMDDKGKIEVNGPLENKLMFYGLLEVAKETCVDFNKAQEKRVQLAPASVIGHIAGTKGS